MKELTIEKLSKVFTKFKNKWVALTEDNVVIASGDTLDSVLKKAYKKGFPAPITAKIPDSKYEFVLCLQ